MFDVRRNGAGPFAGTPCATAVSAVLRAHLLCGLCGLVVRQACVEFALSLVLPSAAASSLYNSCLSGLLAAGAGGSNLTASVVAGCAGYALGTAHPNAAPFWGQCVAAGGDVAACVYQKMVPLGTSRHSLTRSLAHSLTATTEPPAHAPSLHVSMR